MKFNPTRREAIVGMTVAAASAGFVLEGCTAPNWVNVAVADLPTIINIAGTVASIVADALSGGVLAPAIAAAIAVAANAAKVAVPIIQQLIADYNANPSASIVAKIKTALVDLQGNLSQILDAARVIDPVLRATITGAIGLAIGVITGIMSLLPAPVAVAGAKKAQMKAQGAWVTKPTDASTITAQLNAFLVENGYGRYAK
jgi:hypothetical protein